MITKMTFEEVLKKALKEAVKDFEEEHGYFEETQKELGESHFKETCFKLYDNLAKMTRMMADLGIPKDVIIKVAERGIEQAKKREAKQKSSVAFSDNSIERIFSYILDEINKNEK